MTLKTANGLAYSEDALQNRQFLLSKLNDITIYVEDKDKEYLYEEIFERLFDRRVKSIGVIALDGKPNVFDGQRKIPMRDSKGRISIFLVDGDFDILWNENKKIEPNLIYLDRYNIECYLCDKEALIIYLRNYFEMVRSEVESCIKFDEWSSYFYSESLKLFKLFAVANLNRLRIGDVGTAMSFLDLSGHLKNDSYLEYKGKVEEHVSCLEDDLNKVDRKMEDNFIGNERDRAAALICGKYAFESLCRHIRTVTGKGLKTNQVKKEIIHLFDLSTLDFLKQRIEEIITDNTRPIN